MVILFLLSISCSSAAVDGYGLRLAYGLTATVAIVR